MELVLILILILIATNLVVIQTVAHDQKEKSVSVATDSQDKVWAAYLSEERLLFVLIASPSACAPSGPMLLLNRL